MGREGSDIVPLAFGLRSILSRHWSQPWLHVTVAVRERSPDSGKGTMKDHSIVILDRRIFAEVRFTFDWVPVRVTIDTVGPPCFLARWATRPAIRSWIGAVVLVALRDARNQRLAANWRKCTGVAFLLEETIRLTA